MELNETTINFLKNFASIQPNIVIEKGSVLKTMAEARNVLAYATIEQEFPETFGIYDLNEFLGVMNLVDEPVLRFMDGSVEISNSAGTTKIKYFYSDPQMLTSPTKELVMPEAEVEFKLEPSTLDRIRRASATLGHDKLTIEPCGGSIRLTVVDTNDVTSNSMSVEVPGSYQNDKFKFVISIPNIKIIPGSYDVKVSSKLISKFESRESNLDYFIALEKSSTYGE